METIANINDLSVMMNSYEKYHESCGGENHTEYTDYKAGFSDCYKEFNNSNSDLELRERVKDIGVEDFFNDSVENVSEKIEKEYPEIANWIANKRFENVLKDGNLTERQMDIAMKSATTENIKHWINDATDEDVEILVDWMLTSCRDTFLNMLPRHLR